MKKYWIIAAVAGSLVTSALFAQSIISVPKAVKEAFAQKFPQATPVNWEKEKGNYEANWGGKSGEDNSALYTSGGQFIELAKAISVNELPAPALVYLKNHFKKKSVNEAALVTDAMGKITYEAEVEHKDMIFDERGNFLKTEKD